MAVKVQVQVSWVAAGYQSPHHPFTLLPGRVTSQLSYLVPICLHYPPLTCTSCSDQFDMPPHPLHSARWSCIGFLSELFSLLVRTACSTQQCLPAAACLAHHLTPSLTAIQAHPLSARTGLSTGVSVPAAASQVQHFTPLLPLVSLAARPPFLTSFWLQDSFPFLHSIFPEPFTSH
jgi:hypothetical protein